MLNTRLFSLIRKEFIQIIRDPRTLMLTFLMPVMQLLLLGYAATNDVRNVSLAVYDLSAASALAAALAPLAVVATLLMVLLIAGSVLHGAGAG